MINFISYNLCARVNHLKNGTLINQDKWNLFRLWPSSLCCTTYWWTLLVRLSISTEFIAPDQSTTIMVLTLQKISNTSLSDPPSRRTARTGTVFSQFECIPSSTGMWNLDAARKSYCLQFLTRLRLLSGGPQYRKIWLQWRGKKVPVPLFRANVGFLPPSSWHQRQTRVGPR